MVWSLEHAKAKDYIDLADWLEKSFPGQYDRGVHYLRQLSGQCAMTRERLPGLSWLSPNQIQRAAPARLMLPDPLANDTHNLRVQFHRL